MPPVVVISPKNIHKVVLNGSAMSKNNAKQVIKASKISQLSRMSELMGNLPTHSPS